MFKEKLFEAVMAQPQTEKIAERNQDHNLYALEEPENTEKEKQLAGIRADINFVKNEIQNSRQEIDIKLYANLRERRATLYDELKIAAREKDFKRADEIVQELSLIG